MVRPLSVRWTRTNTVRSLSIRGGVPIWSSIPIWSRPHQYGPLCTNTGLTVSIRSPYQYGPAPISTPAAYQYGPVHTNTTVAYQYTWTVLICGFLILFIRPLKLGFRRARLNCASGVLSGGFRHLKTHRYGWKPRKLRNSKYLTRISMSGCLKRSKMNQKHRFPLGSLLCTSKH